MQTRKLVRYQEIVNRAEKVARTQIDEPLHIPDICKAGTVSPRTLRTAFLTVCGVTPYRYLRALRMAEARQALLSPIAETVTVTDVAMQFGFFELGRFSVEYRTAFGECPSVTLRRSNSARCSGVKLRNFASNEDSIPSSM